MNTFGAYAKYYDLFYSDKDYLGEALFVAEALRRHNPNVVSLLDLGCGTGRHAIEFARLGFDVVGVDRSPNMIECAIKNNSQSGRDIDFQVSEIADYHSGRLHDAVVSLFHVMSYQTSNNALRATLQSVARNLAPGGLFLFDFWYGPAVCVDRPSTRIRRVSDKDWSVLRISESSWEPNSNRVDVHYEILALDKRNNSYHQFHEIHAMRYFFLPEVELLLDLHGFTVIKVGEWMTGDYLTERSWNAYLIARLDVG